jgi:excisionase family DNA binding protein
VSYSGPQRSKGFSDVAQLDSRPRFLTVAEVADLMRVSTMTVYRLIKAGELAAVRVGRSYRIPDSEVDRYLEARFTQAG